MIGRLLSLFKKEPVEVESLDRAPETFREQKQDELEDARQSAEDIRDETGDALDELQEFLEDLEDYEDEKNRSIVEDVVDNVAGDRLELLDRELPDDPHELLKELEDIVQQFNDVKQKEAAVLEEANLGKELSRAVSDLEDTRDRLKNFLENSYSTVDTLEELEGLAEERQQLQLEVQDLEDEHEEKKQSIEQKREQKQETAEEIDGLTESPEWQDYREQEEKLEWLKQERKEKELDLKKAASKMERGMKKLVYQIENKDLDFSGDLSILKDIRDGDQDALLERDTQQIVDAMEEATGVLPMDLLDDSVHQRFMDGAQYLMELEDHHSELAQLREQVENKRQELENHPAREKKQELEKKKKRLERELNDLQQEKQDTSRELERKREELERIENGIRELLETGLDRDVKFVNGATS